LIIAYKDKDAQSLTTDVAVKCSKVRGSTAGHAAARPLVYAPVVRRLGESRKKQAAELYRLNRTKKIIRLIDRNRDIKNINFMVHN